MSDSMHRDHDLDLISALVDGSLADPTRARELVDTCPECAEVYRAHLTVREAVEAEEAPLLNDMERARLHSRVWEEVNRPVGAPRSGSPWWYRLAPVAAALVVVVGVATLGGRGGEDAVTEVADRTVDGGGEDGATQMAPFSESATPDTEAPESTISATDEEADAGGDAGGSTESSELEASMTELRRRVEEGDRFVPDLFDCESPTPDPGPLLSVELHTFDGEPTWLAAFGEPDESKTIVAYRRSDCSIVAEDR